MEIKKKLCNQHKEEVYVVCFIVVHGIRFGNMNKSLH